MLPVILVGLAGSYFLEEELEEITDDVAKVLVKMIEWTVDVVSTLLGQFFARLNLITWVKRAFFGSLNIVLKKEILTLWLTAFMIILSFLFVKRNI